MPLVELAPGEFWVHFAKPGLESKLFLSWAYENGSLGEGVSLIIPSSGKHHKQIQALRASIDREGAEGFYPVLILIPPPKEKRVLKIKRMANVITQTVVANGRMWITTLKDREDRPSEPVEVLPDTEIPTLSNPDAKSTFDRLLEEGPLDDSSAQPTSSKA